MSGPVRAGVNRDNTAPRASIVSFGFAHFREQEGRASVFEVERRDQVREPPDGAATLPERVLTPGSTDLVPRKSTSRQHRSTADRRFRLKATPLVGP